MNSLFAYLFDNVTFNIDVPAYADVARIFSLTNDEVSAVGQTVRWVQFSFFFLVDKRCIEQRRIITMFSNLIA